MRTSCRPPHQRHRVISALTSIVFTALMSAACGHDSSPLAPSTATPSPEPSPTTPTTVVTLSGSITNEATGAGVAGATVELTAGPQMTAPATSGADGRYRFANLVAGTYGVRVSHEGFDPTATSVALAADRTLDVRLAPLPDIPGPSDEEAPHPVAEIVVTGAVTDETSHAPVPNARIRVRDGVNRGLETMSTADGRFSLGPLEPGAMTIRVEADGFASTDRNLTAEDDVSLAFALAATPPPPSGPAVTGRAVDVLSGAPVADVHVRIVGGGESVGASDGRFSVSGTSGSTQRIVLSSSVTVDRQTRIGASGEPTVSLIPRAFDLAAFDQMLRSRGGLLRWVAAPHLVVERRVLSFTNTTDATYAATTTLMSDAEATALATDLAWALPQLTGGTLPTFASVTIAVADVGGAVAISRPDTIVVARFEGLDATINAWGYGRWAWNGAGEVTAGAIMLDDDFERSGSPYRRSLRAHELGHALGYDHVASGPSVMHPAARTEPTAFDRDATAIAFHRRPLNTSPDVDPDTATVSRASRASVRWEGRP